MNKLNETSDQYKKRILVLSAAILLYIYINYNDMSFDIISFLVAALKKKFICHNLENSLKIRRKKSILLCGIQSY